MRAAERTIPLEVVPVGGVAPGPGPDAKLGHRHAGPAQHHLAAVLHRRALGRHRAGRAKRRCSPLAEEREAAAASRAAGDLQGHYGRRRGQGFSWRGKWARHGGVLGEWQRSARVLFGHGKRGAGHVEAPVTARARVGLSRTRSSFFSSSRPSERK